MNSPCRFLAVLSSFAVLCLSTVFAGPLQRVPNTTLQMPPTPPILGFTSTNAFGTLVFSNAMGMATPPGETNRLFVVEKNGTIAVITNLANPTRTVFMNITARVTSTVANSGSSGEQGLLGLAFHPGYATNRYFYVFYTGTATTTATDRHDILSRFETFAGNPNLGDPNSELRLFAQLDTQPNHNGGDIKFGPDGYLYIPLGDEGGGNDNQNNSQIITNDFFSGIFRIDVDKRGTNLPPRPHPSLLGQTNYFVPSDNPFIGATSFNGIAINSNMVRTEFWAVGLRNPWRMNFDSLNGRLYVGDVGQGAREEIDVITKGGNYGWAYREGNIAGPKAAVPGFVGIDPIIDYPAGSGLGQGRAVIAGPVYYGTRLSQLTGAFIYADNVSGNFWALRYDGVNVLTNFALPTTGSGTFIDTGISSFGVDPRNGDILYADLETAPNSVIRRINYNQSASGTPLPPTLADTGAFADLVSLTPHAGVVPYDINVPFWSDNAIKSRWVSLPNTNLTFGFSPADNWSFPTGTVWVKHFDLELTNGVPSSKVRLETRLLVRNAAGVYGVTYRWGNSATNATLVPEEGLDETFLIDDGGGIIRTQVWRYPSRAECLTCHTPAGGLALGFNTPQLNHDHDYSGVVTNQILALSEAGYLNTNVASVEGLIALAHATNTAATLDFRARSYFAANCVQCHHPVAGLASANWDARITTPTGQAGLIEAIPVNSLGDPNNRVVKPGSPANSTLFRRVAEFGPFHMPPIATSVTNIQAVALLNEWILSLTNTFWINPTPNTLSVVAGNNTGTDVDVIVTDDFAGLVTLSVSGLPANTSASFDPPVIGGSTNSVLTIMTTASTPLGTYPLTISGIGGGQTNTGIISLSVTVIPPVAPGTLLWTGHTGDTNWSTGINWTNITAGGFGPPGVSNSVTFNNTGAAPGPGIVNNIVDMNLTGTNSRIVSLTYGNTPGFHRTLIPDGQTLMISSLATANALFVGTGADSGANALVHSAIAGSNATFTINNFNGNMNVRQGGSAGTHQAVLDLSGLGTFNATIARLMIAGDGGSGAADSRLSGVVYLARTNNLILIGGSVGSPALNIGDHPSNGRGNPPITLLPSYLYLGQTNAILVNTLTVGRQKAAPSSMLFNPAFIDQNPTALFRGTAGINSRVSTWSIGDNSAQATSNQASEGTNDFSGGHVDALVLQMFVGRGELGAGNIAGTGTGTLTFDQGTIDVTTLEVGYQLQAGSASAGIGTVNVNGTGTLNVNSSLRLALYSGGTNYSHGTLNVNGGFVRTPGITAGGGISTVRINGGSLTVTNSAGAPNARLSSVNLTNATLRFRLNTASIGTNINAAALNVGGVNSIEIDSLQNLSGPATFPMISYTNLSGAVGNFVVGTISDLPSHYSAQLVHNAAQNRIDLVLAPHFPAFTAFTTAGAGSQLIVDGTNGVPGGEFYVLSATNIALPLSSWTFIATNLFDGTGQFRFTNAIDPNAPQQFYLIQMP